MAITQVGDILVSPSPGATYNFGNASAPRTSPGNSPFCSDATSQSMIRHFAASPLNEWYSASSNNPLCNLIYERND